LLPGEERPDEINASLVANRLRELVGPVIGTERLIFGSGGNFGGSPVSVSLLSNNISELKLAKEELKAYLISNPLLKDIEDNDPAGIKEIRLELKENAYFLGLDLRAVMNQVRSGFLECKPSDFKEDRMK
jgi:multidrug efflux pump subunit AcrB